MDVIELISAPVPEGKDRHARHLDEIESALMDVIELISAPVPEGKDRHAGREIESALMDVIELISAPVPEGKDRHARQLVAVADILDIDQAGETFRTWKRINFHRQAHRSNLGGPRLFSRPEWDEFDRVLDDVLDRIESRYELFRTRLIECRNRGPGQSMKAIEAVLCKTPPGSQAIGLQWFLSEAEPGWVESLPSCVLDNAPGMRRVTGTTDRYTNSNWPVSRYLARVAPDAPAAVGRVILRLMKEAPDNQSIHRDFAEASLSLSLADAVAWAKGEAAWISTHDSHWVGASLGMTEAARSLVDRGRPDAGLELASAMLALGGPERGRRKTPQTRFDPFDYSRVLEELRPPLTAALPVETYSLLLKTLADSLADLGVDEQRWTSALVPSIEDHPQNSPDSILHAIINATRDAGSDVAAARGFATAEAMLTPYGGHLFERLRLALAQRHAAADELVLVLTDGRAFEGDCWHETYELISARGHELAPSDLEAVIQAINSSTLPNQSKETLVGLMETSVSGDEGSLESHPNFTAWIEVRTPEAAVSADELNGWDVAKVVEFLGDWVNKDDHQFRRLDVTSPFQAAVEADPDRYLRDPAIRFLPSTFASSMLYAVDRAARAKTPFDTAALIELLHDTLVSSRIWSGDSVPHAAAFVLGTVLMQAKPPIELAQRTKMWGVIETLSRDAGRVAGRQAGAKDSADRLISDVLNDVRSLSIRQAAHYAKWLQAVGAVDHGTLPPEAASLIAAQIYGTSDSPLSARAAVAYEWPLLVELDGDWAARHSALLFQPDDQEQRDAARVGYLGSPYGLNGRTLSAMIKQYREWLGAGSGLSSEAAETIGQQIVSQYWRGELTLDEVDLVSLVFRSIPGPVSHRLLDWVGWVFWRDRAKGIPEEAIDRVRQMWDTCETDWIGSPIYQSFSWWFASGLFGDDWAFDRLGRALRSDQIPDHPYLLVERFEEVLDVEPNRVGSMADLLLSRAGYGTELSATSDGLIRIGKALAAQPDRAAADGRSILNRLRSRGLDVD
jgi:hypothetical protein